MRLIADRFLSAGLRGEALDLATNARVRLDVDARAPVAEIAARTAVYDRLASLRHPLLVPIVDYGADGRGWFEAHEHGGPAAMAPSQRRAGVLHVLRFLRAAGVEMTARDAAQNVRTAVNGVAGGRWLGVFLRERPALEAVRTLLEAGGPPGTMAIDVIGQEGSGLRTVRLQIARLARLAGFVVVDGQRDAVPGAPFADRHLCAFDWLPRARRLPRVLASAAARGGRRHLWIRFCRVPPAPAEAGSVQVQLEPMMRDEFLSTIYLDVEQGPAPAAVRGAAAGAGGWPGPALVALGAGVGCGAGWVHETSPEYNVAAPDRVPPAAEPQDAGIARLRRGVDGARDLLARRRHARAARVLERSGPALAARGAMDDAAAAACDLGELLLDRARPARAIEAFERARAWDRTGTMTVRTLVGSGRALFDLARLSEAEAVFRTASAPGGDGAARVWLARTLWQRGQLDAARSALGDGWSALRSRILLAQGHVEAAAADAHAALSALEGRADDEACEAHVAAAEVHAAMRDAIGVERHMHLAAAAARRVRSPARRLVVMAERWACLARCGAATPARSRERLLRAASRLPPLDAATIRAALRAPARTDPAVSAANTAPTLVQHFQSLVDAMHDLGDEHAALQAIAASLMRTLGACSVAIRSAQPNQLVAAAGRPWPGEMAISSVVLNGGAGLARDGVTPETVEPIAAAGSVLGALALRWVAGAGPERERARDFIKVTAVAAAPLLRALARVEPPSSATYPDELLGRGEAAEAIRAAIRRAAQAPYPVLVEGESGCGKELVARAIHARGVRRVRKFCAVNCAALADDLLEAELFGHTRGAFTGAMQERAGLFEEADQGTLFLDEVGELSARAQAKLLRVLQEGEVRRVGENLARKVDVRIVAATNRPLEHEAQAGRFRTDLRFRLDVIRIVVPPLRDRADDLPWLADRIWREAAARVGSRAALGDDALAALSRYDWPGNVRELQNVIASLAVHAPRRGRVPLALLPACIAREAARPHLPFDQARLEFERRYVRAALARAAGNRGSAADALGVSRQGLTKILRRLRIE